MSVKSYKRRSRGVAVEGSTGAARGEEGAISIVTSAEEYDRLCGGGHTVEESVTRGELSAGDFFVIGVSRRCVDSA
jgi:hypothetical protein